MKTNGYNGQGKPRAYIITIRIKRYHLAFELQIHYFTTTKPVLGTSGLRCFHLD